MLEATVQLQAPLSIPTESVRQNVASTRVVLPGLQSSVAVFNHSMTCSGMGFSVPTAPALAGVLKRDQVPASA